ncbi:hypothetical protein CJU90_0290 [Yarrowia sp. C11]|nr:hypothetical protein CJU90_0290 [Yarrowia sp. C11]
MEKNPYEPLEDISRRLKSSLETTMKSHAEFRDTELRLHNIGREMGQLYNRAKTGNELLKVESKKAAGDTGL